MHLSIKVHSLLPSFTILIKVVKTSLVQSTRTSGPRLKIMLYLLQAFSVILVAGQVALCLPYNHIAGSQIAPVNDAFCLAAEGSDLVT